MHVQTTNRTVHIGRTDQLSGFTLTETEFTALREHIFGYYRNRDPHNKMTPLKTITFLAGYDVTIDGLDSFVLIEEIEKIMSVVELPQPYNDMFTLIYNNIKYQAYRCSKVTIEIQ